MPTEADIIQLVMPNLQSASGEELRPLFGRTLTSSPSAASGMASVLDRVFRGKL